MLPTKCKVPSSPQKLQMLFLIKLQTSDESIRSFSTHSRKNHMALKTIINHNIHMLSPFFLSERERDCHKGQEFRSCHMQILKFRWRICIPEVYASFATCRVCCIQVLYMFATHKPKMLPQLSRFGSALDERMRNNLCAWSLRSIFFVSQSFSFVDSRECELSR